ncbi:uncharacterized protein LOC125656577 [Ostrea edulis]|uniref:uncharacterized protein LOC125656577 n=1 Tax=Ostrea edulis TaxID=37623 RepID=UPI0024AF18C3|nr:uncharacterized protein LOC125656577 [Ostrea edulis]
MEHGGTCGVDDWNLPMSDYIVGFGQTVSCDHWIGLRNMLYLTQSGGTYKLEVNIELQDGNTDSVYYEYFYIKDQSEWTLRLDNFNGSTNNFLGNGFSNPPTSSDADLIDNEDFEGSGVNIYGCSGGDKSGWWFDEFCTNPNLCLPLGPVEEALYPSVRKLKWPDRFGNEYLVKRVNMQIRRAT